MNSLREGPYSHSIYDKLNSGNSRCKIQQAAATSFLSRQGQGGAFTLTPREQRVPTTHSNISIEHSTGPLEPIPVISPLL